MQILPAVEAIMWQDLGLSLKPHSCSLKRYVCWRERVGRWQWTRIYLWRPVESFSWVPFCVKICMQINADWKGTATHPRRHAEVNMSTINTMSKVTLT